MNLTEKPETVNWPVTHYVYVEKVGPFQNTAQKAWGELHAQVAEATQGVKVLGFMALYQIEPEMVYRAGAKVSGKPAILPSGFQYVQFAGGKYSQFTLTGSYSQLPEACGRVFEIVDELDLPMRDDFFIENYVNDPKSTPEAELLTQILIPTE